MAINVALYDPREKRWAMTERGRAQLHRDRQNLHVGPSAVRWTGSQLIIDFDEIAVPRPPAEWGVKRLSGVATITPSTVTGTVYDIDGAGRHRWWPVAPSSAIDVQMRDGTRWHGHGYLDSNWGMEPLQSGFARWDWARGSTADDGAMIFYDTELAGGEKRALSLAIDRDGAARPLDAPPSVPLKRGFWGVERFVRCDPGATPKLLRTLEDGPFYLRSLVETRIGGTPVTLIHESVSGSRFSSPIVRAMLPFRMPRRSRF